MKNMKSKKSETFNLLLSSTEKLESIILLLSSAEFGVRNIVPNMPPSFKFNMAGSKALNPCNDSHELGIHIIQLNNAHKELLEMVYKKT